MKEKSEQEIQFDAQWSTFWLNGKIEWIEKGKVRKKYWTVTFVKIYLLSFKRWKFSFSNLHFNTPQVNFTFIPSFFSKEKKGGGVQKFLLTLLQLLKFQKTIQIREKNMKKRRSRRRKFFKSISYPGSYGKRHLWSQFPPFDIHIL